MTSKNTARQEARRSFWREHDKSSYKCPDCGRGSQLLRTGFEVHHTDGDPANNKMDNLVALCRPCHNIREGKKPSLNELELIQEQLNNTRTLIQNTPLVESSAEVSEVWDEFEEICKPYMVMKQIRRRKYVQLEVDFVAARGWKEVKTQAGDVHEPTPQLTLEAAQVVNAIMNKYNEEKTPKHSISAPKTAYGATTISYPPLLPEVCQRLASELRPIVMNESNWEPDHPNLR